jgi:prevent-host-death family protein
MAVEVGVRELRSKLSHWLDRAKNGEEVIVTERGKPVARITAAGYRETWDRLIEEGVITRATKPREPIDVDKLPRLKEGTLTEILIEQRRSARY